MFLDKFKSKFSRTQWMVLITIGSVHFSCAVCISLQAPFYPAEAEKKGATATEYGFVFGIFELVAFLSSPVLGKYMDYIGPKFMLNSGIVIAALCSILFGLLDLIPTHTEFIALSFAIRIIESLGASAATTAAFSITAAMFPNRVATIFATLEIFYGLGYIVGPLIGGVLFSVGKYVLPFVVMGVVLLLDGAFVYFFLPIKDDDDVCKNKPKGKIFAMFKVPAVVLDVFCVTSAAISMGFYAATLEPHLREFKLGAVWTGVMFIISGTMYAISAPLVGRMCDRGTYPKRLLAIGSTLIITSYILVGPFPGLPLPKSLVMCIIGLIIHGIGIACILVSSFIDIIRSSVAYGFGDDLTTYGVVSGLWGSFFALGAFIGPSVAGILYDEVGFSYGTVFVIVVHLLVFLSSSIFICVENRFGSPKGILTEEPSDNDNKVYSSVTEWPPQEIPSLVSRISEGSHSHYGSLGSSTTLMQLSP